ncbi:MutS protein-like protein 5 [Bienertia sinuspersici]
MVEAENNEKCGYVSVDTMYYLVPGLSLENGLRKIVGDEEVLQMVEIANKYRAVEVYLVHCDVEPMLSPCEPAAVCHTTTTLEPHVQTIEKEVENPSTKVNKRKKLTPKKGPQSKLMSPSRKSPRNLKDSSTFKKPSTSSLFISFPSLTDPTTTTTPLQPHNTEKESEIPSQIPVSPSEKQTPSQVPSLECQLPVITTETPIDYEWEENRGDSPLKWSELIGDYEGSSDDDDPSFDIQYQKLCEGHEFDDEDDDEEDDDFDVEAELGDEASGDEGLSDLDLQEEADIEETEQLECFVNESDEDDDELLEARDRVCSVNTKLVDLARQLQLEACEGRLGHQTTETLPLRSASTAAQEGVASDCDDSAEEEQTPNNSGDEGELNERVKKGELVRGDIDFRSFSWRVGQRFTNRSEFKEAVSKYAVMQGRDISYVLSNKKKEQLGVKCAGDCPFYLYCSMHSRDRTWLVKTVVDSHTCHRSMSKNRQLTSTWIARQLLEVFKARPHWPAKEIIETVRRAYRVIVRRDFAYKVKYHAHRMLHGSMKDHYMKIERYKKALKKASPGTEVELVVEAHPNSSTPVFKRMFVCFDGVKEGWKAGCRRVICVDAAFLKTFLGGQIMTAVGRDPNDQMYPISWAAVEGENNLSWVWFFTHLQSYLDLGDGTGLAVISDEHQAILHAVAVVLPKAEHRHCARHIFSLWHRTYKGDEMKIHFWKIAKAYNQADFNDAWDELNEINPEAALAFKRYNPKHFCRAFLDTCTKTDAITNNMAETFNAYIISARTKHIIYMFEDIRVALMQRLVKRRKEMEKCSSVLCPRIQARLEKEKEKASNCDVLPSSDSVFNVRYYLDQLNVDLVARTCSCRKWNMVGVPCCHAIACIFFMNKEAEAYVDDCYKLETFFKAYGGSIPPCEGERYWPRVPCNLDPPPIKIGPGRPRKNRIKHPLENPKKPGSLLRTGIEMTCSICKSKGHNKRSCPDKGSYVPTEPPPKRPRGRPRKTMPNSQMASSSTPSSMPQPSTQHHSTTAQPTQLGRGGRMILGGQGARGVSQASVRGQGRTGLASTEATELTSGTGQGRGRGRGRGRGKGRNQTPIGVGVLFSQDGSPICQV